MPAEDYDDHLIERIVQEVIRRLLERGVATAAAPAATQELVLAERVVTLETLRDRLNGVRIVAVTARAIVTPAVKDELRDRGIELKKR